MLRAPQRGLIANSSKAFNVHEHVHVNDHGFQRPWSVYSICRR